MPISTPAPISNIRAIISAVALQGGAEFNDPNSYQSKALRFLETTLSPKTAEEYIEYYALASIYYASYGVPNAVTLRDFGNITLPGWISSNNWVTNTNKCTWYGITCDAKDDVFKIELITNRMYGNFAPETQLLAKSLNWLDLYNNEYLFNPNEAFNSFLGELVNIQYLFFGTTSFQYDGIPTFLSKLTKLSKSSISSFSIVMFIGC
jgi:hypothetical protein